MMSLLLLVFTYVLVWWVVLFTILPLGVRRHGEEGRGHDAGAPEKPDLKKKLIITSAVSAAVVAVFYTLSEMNIIRWHEWFDGSPLK